MMKKIAAALAALLLSCSALLVQAQPPPDPIDAFFQAYDLATRAMPACGVARTAHAARRAFGLCYPRIRN